MWRLSYGDYLHSICTNVTMVGYLVPGPEEKLERVLYHCVVNWKRNEGQSEAE